ncbi:MAG: translation elongation factor Ts [Calditrichaeota bacterium]|nr:translation elongation factor Ts [Calditrichota bacterium]
MTPVNSKDVVTLREKTGLGMMDCKRALEATDGDFDKAIEYLRKKGIAKGEARIGRTAGEGIIHSYIHPGARIGVLIEVGCETDFVARSEDFQRLVHDLSMQVAATAPIAVRREDIPAEKIERELEIYREQIRTEGKPEQIIEKIAHGKLEKYYQDVCLLEQNFVKDQKVKVGDYVLEIAGKLKENIQVRRFARFVLGD